MNKTKTNVILLKPGKLPRRLEMKLRKLANDLRMCMAFAASIESDCLHHGASYAEEIQKLQKDLDAACRYAKTL